MKTAEQMAARYQSAMSSDETQKRYVQGIDSTTVNPMEQAAAADDLFLKRVRESVESGRRKAKLLGTPKQRWVDGAKKKGASRISSGALQAMDKVRSHFQDWAPKYQAISDEVAKMPKGTLQSAKDRSAKAIEMAMQYAGRIA